jgi:hypothetical protein
MKGMRVQAVVQELHGEKMDVVLWNEDPETFLMNALSPAKPSRVVKNEEARTMIAVAADHNQLVHLIGRGGQNARLASKLTGWKVEVVTEADLRGGTPANSGTPVDSGKPTDAGHPETTSAPDISPVSTASPPVEPAGPTEAGTPSGPAEEVPGARERAGPTEAGTPSGPAETPPTETPTGEKTTPTESGTA